MAGLVPAMTPKSKIRIAGSARRRGPPGAQFRNGEFGVTASIGIAHLDRTVTDIDELLGRAHAALYAAKAAGRDHCVEWQSTATALPGLRRRVLKAGSITFNGGASIIDCTVRSLSDTGTSLDVIDAVGVPRQFKLRIASEDTSRFCRVMHKQCALDRGGVSMRMEALRR